MCQPIRVLCVFSTLDRGGSETMCMNVFRQIDRNKVQFDFVKHTESVGDYEEEITELGGEIFSAPRYNAINHFSYLNWWHKHFQLHPEHKLLHIHYFTFAGLICPIAKKYNVVTVTHAHTSVADSIYKKILINNIRNVTDYHFACSKEAGEFLYGKSIVNSPTFMVLPNAINTKEYTFNAIIRDKVRNNFEISDEILFGHIGNFTEVKNHHFLLDIFSVIKGKKECAKLMLVGDGPLRNEIEEYARHLGLENDIIFTGVRSDVNELVQAMDFFVFPSLFEGLGLVVVEAQTSGLPCVISDTVPDECILTSDLVSVMSLQQSAEEWANHILSRIGQPRVSHAEEVRAHGYDIAETSKWLEEFYLSKANETR